MIVIPAIELRDGRCAPLADGASVDHTRTADPADMAREFARIGFGRLHLVDLDAATGRGSNARLMRDVIRDADVDVQAGGGLRHDDAIRDLLDEGARWAVVGTRGVRDLDWLADLAGDRPGEIILAVDVTDGRVASPGWSRSLPRTALDLAEEIGDLPLGGLLVTSSGRGGPRDGPDLRLVDDLVDVTTVPVLSSGGISTLAHLRALEDRGATGAVIGQSLYAGALNPAAVAMEFGE